MIKTRKMKRALITLLVTLFSYSFIFSQQFLSFNNRVTIPAISFTSDGRYMLVGGYAKIFDVKQPGSEPFRTMKEEAMGDISYMVGISRDDRTFFVSKSNRLEIWDLQSKTKRKTIRDGRLVVRAVCFSTDSKYIVYMRNNGELVFIHSESFNESHKQKITDEKPTALISSPDGSKLIVGTRSGSLIVYDLGTRKTDRFKITGKSIYNIDIPSACDHIAASSSDGIIWLGKFPSMETVRSWQAHSDGLTAISFHPSGQYLASGGKDKRLHVWNIPACTIIYELDEEYKLPLLSLAFSPDGSTIATGLEKTQGYKILSSQDDVHARSFSLASSPVSSIKNKPPSSSVVSQSIKASATSTSAQKRLALLIGNGNYPNSFLANPENDALEMKNILQQYGFDVLLYENLSQTRMKMAMDEFGDRLKNYDVGLFFYAGHGIQSKGYNYLIPVDANIKSEEQVEYDCVQADRILALMEASGTDVNIIILDACRNNPFERSWTRSATGKGLAFMNAPKGSLIAYATAPGSTASDGSGKNGLYTSALLESIRIPDLNILQIFQNVRNIVSQKSNGLQIPWESTSLTGDFYFQSVQ